jgi:hypothetical protein
MAAFLPDGQKGRSVKARGVGAESVEPQSDDGEFVVCFTWIKSSPLLYVVLRLSRE